MTASRAQWFQRGGVRRRGGPFGPLVRALAAVLILLPVAVDVAGASADDLTATPAGLEPQVAAPRALAEHLVALSRDPGAAPTEKAFQVSRAAVAARQAMVGDQLGSKVGPLLDQQRRNLDLAEDLIDASKVEGRSELDLGAALARRGTEWQAATLGLDLEAVDLERFEHRSPSEAGAALVDRRGGELSAGQREDLAELDRLPAGQQDALTAFIDAFLTFEVATDAAYAGGDQERLEVLAAEMEAGTFDPQAHPDLRDGDVLAMLGVDLAPMLAARQDLLDAALGLADAFSPPAAGPDGAMGAQSSSSTIDPVQVAPYLSIALSPYDANTYTTNFHLMVDVGGDDTYLNNAGGSWEFAAALVDLSGSDNYTSGGSGGVNGGGSVGAGFLLDAAGNDVYEALRGGTNGGANIGTGFLLDAIGHDHYNATNDGTNGGGAFGGVGMLVDAVGSDVFDARTTGTNGGADAGVGFLVGGGSAVTEGTDEYNGWDDGTNGGGTFGGQGFLLDADLSGDEYTGGNNGANGGGAGVGGTGFLADGGGADLYSANARGTNGGGALGSGFLLDIQGSDGYTATREATNGGANLGGVGFLIDLLDSDWYSAWDGGTNGGATGAFLAGAGLLFDGTGNDTYAANGSGTNGGALAANGFLVDGAGNDIYNVTGSGGVNGGGGSVDWYGVGLLYDQGGHDTYYDEDPPATNGTGTNRTKAPKGEVGAQIDVPLPTVSMPTTSTVPKLTTTSLPLPTTTSIPLPTTTVPTVTTTTTSSTTTTSTTTTTVPPTTTTTTPPSGEGSNVGAGGFMGSVEFDSPGLPPIAADCAPSTFDFTGEAQGFVLNTTILGYAGDVTFTGTGSSDCENGTAGGGTMNLSAEGEGPTESTIVCESLTGDFSRVLVRAQINLTGDCTINGVNTTGIVFSADVLVVPEGEGAGITGPVMSAVFAGGFAVSPG